MREARHFVPPDHHAITARMMEAEKAYRTAVAYVQAMLSEVVVVDHVDILQADKTGIPVHIPTPLRVSKFHDPSPGGAKEVFQFIPDYEWEAWYQSKSIKKSNAKMTEALTVYGAPTKIGVQTGYYTFGTLVHETFHYLSHVKFRMAVTPAQNEGFTELLARVAMNDMRPRSDIRGHGDFNGDDLKGIKKCADPEDREEMVRLVQAYILGDAVALRMITAFLKI